MKNKITDQDVKDGIERVTKATSCSAEEFAKMAKSISQAGISFKELSDNLQKAMPELPIYEGSFEQEIILPQEDLQQSLGTARHPFFCRWWLKTRSNKDFPDLNELYIPWWAWPFELAHRLIFGSTKITK